MHAHSRPTAWLPALLILALCAGCANHASLEEARETTILATVQSIDGTAELMRAGGDSWVLAEPAVHLYSGDALEVRWGEVVLLLRGGKTQVLAAGTRMEFELN